MRQLAPRVAPPPGCVLGRSSSAGPGAVAAPLRAAGAGVAPVRAAFYEPIGRRGGLAGRRFPPSPLLGRYDSGRRGHGAAAGQLDAVRAARRRRSPPGTVRPRPPTRRIAAILDATGEQPGEVVLFYQPEASQIRASPGSSPTARVHQRALRLAVAVPADRRTAGAVRPRRRRRQLRHGAALAGRQHARLLPRAGDRVRLHDCPAAAERVARLRARASPSRTSPAARMRSAPARAVSRPSSSGVRHWDAAIQDMVALQRAAAAGHELEPVGRGSAVEVGPTGSAWTASSPGALAPGSRQPAAQARSPASSWPLPATSPATRPTHLQRRRRRPRTCCRSRHVGPALGADAVLPLGDKQYEDGRTAVRRPPTTRPGAGSRRSRIRRPATTSTRTPARAATSPTSARRRATRRRATTPSTRLVAHRVAQLQLHRRELRRRLGAGAPGSRATSTAPPGSKCTLAFWHFPHFTDGPHVPDERGLDRRASGGDLYDAGAELVLNGNDHNYQRFAPRRPTARPIARAAIREFIVGTGGKSLTARRGHDVAGGPPRRGASAC